MAAAQASQQLIEQIKTATGVVDVVMSDSMELTPVLVLAVSLLYMMASDGQIEDEESSQLQSVIGGNEDLLSHAAAYVHKVPVEEFLKLAPAILSTQDKLCILANVCDSMLSDGNCDASELALFEKFQSAFGVKRETFKPYFKIIQLKNDKKVFGSFADIQDGQHQITPHLALAASLLYMMSADGNLGQEEIGQLETVIGEFDGLQKEALGYVRSVKREEFFKQAGPILTRDQILCILSNVCDSMMSDGVVAVVEDRLFLSMVNAFGLRASEFDQFQKVLETKNFKPFDISKFENRTSHARIAGAEQASGEVFDMSGAESELGIEVRRTMHDNIERVQQDFGSDANVIQVNHNATDDLNIQKIATDKPADNTQWLSSKAAKQHLESLEEAAQVDTRVRIDSDATSANVQELGVSAIPSNLQEVSDVDVLVSNRQLLDLDTEDTHLEVLPPEVRMQNLFEDIEVLTQQLDTFEIKNKFMLAKARQARQLQETQRLQAEEDMASNRVALSAQAAIQSTGLAKTHEQTVAQAVGTDVFGSNFQTLSDKDVSANRQTLVPNTPPHDIDLSRSAANSAAMGDGTHGALSLMGIDLGAPQACDLEPASLAIRALSSRSGLPKGRTQGQSVRQSYNYKLHARFAVTFLVLSVWSSNIAAIHRDNPQMAFGKLERLPAVQAVAAPDEAP
jgi:uncharacterized tellurite resistance protein B-like protein